MSMTAIPEDPKPRKVFGLFQHRPPLPTDKDPDKVKVVFNMLREISETEYEAAGAAVGQIHKVLEGFDNDLDRAHLELVQSRQRILDGWISNDAMSDTASWMPELRHRLVTLSVALVMHQSYVVSETGHIHGEDSDLHSAAKKAFNDLYDGSQAYRLLYGFRNAVVHSSRGILRAQNRSQLVQLADGSEHVDKELTVHLVREAFAATKPNAKLRQEVLGMSEDPELLTAATAAYEATKAVHAKLEPTLYPGRAAAIQLLWNYLVETASAGGYGPFFHALTVGDLSQMQISATTKSVVDYVWRTGMNEGLQPPYVLTPLGSDLT